MKLATAILVLFSAHAVFTYSSCVGWRERIQKYNELLNCEYYVTSEVTYGDYFEFQNSTRFYTVTPNTIKFILTSSENDAERHEIVIGENVEEEACCDRNGNQERESFTVSSIRKPNNELKTLVTPGILQSDQPNDIIVNLSEDGYLHITINKNTVLETKSEMVLTDNITDVKYISFAAFKNRHPEEFFYNCNN